MVAILTGDIINSRKGAVEGWIHLLKDTLNNYGNEPKDWEIFRGDSFQLALAPKKALLAAIHIKATLKQTKTYDVRIAIGLGDESYSSPKITEANGTAYVHSGECFEGLKKHSLGIKSAHTALDEALNTMLKLSLLITDNWSSVVSKVIKAALENPEKNQKDLAKLLNRSQSNISEALKRGGYDEIVNMNEFYIKKIAEL